MNRRYSFTFLDLSVRAPTISIKAFLGGGGGVFFTENQPPVNFSFCKSYITWRFPPCSLQEQDVCVCVYQLESRRSLRHENNNLSPGMVPLRHSPLLSLSVLLTYVSAFLDNRIIALTGNYLYSINSSHSTPQFCGV